MEERAASGDGVKRDLDGAAGEVEDPQVRKVLGDVISDVRVELPGVDDFQLFEVGALFEGFESVVTDLGDLLEVVADDRELFQVWSEVGCNGLDGQISDLGAVLELDPAELGFDVGEALDPFEGDVVVELGGLPPDLQVLQVLAPIRQVDKDLIVHCDVLQQNKRLQERQPLYSHLYQHIVDGRDVGEVEVGDVLAGVDDGPDVHILNHLVGVCERKPPQQWQLKHPKQLREVHM
mmetsp:Transcript_4769/g.4423  ORF Transcript_4769/g.4423 Transcript_4769/m.4423 type:complete len:235 (-) Transcript_4769:161-865(-)